MNFDKRHAFIKMFTRKDALAAKEGMEQYRSPDMTLRVCDVKSYAVCNSDVDKWIIDSMGCWFRPSGLQ